MSKDTQHGGGPAGATPLDESGTAVIQPEDKLRGYLIIFADKDNSDDVYLLLTNEPNESSASSAVWGSGIPIAPGSFHEISKVNLTHAKILGVSAPSATAVVSWQLGR